MPCKRVISASLFFLLVSAAPAMDIKPFGGKALSDIFTSEAAAGPKPKIIQGRVQRGDTASLLLKPYLSIRDIFKIDQQAAAVFPLTRIRRGQPYKIILNPDHFFAFEYEINADHRLVIKKQGQDYTISKQPMEYDIREEVVSVDIESSLAEAVLRAGEYSSLTWKLSDIFAWDIDFIKDIRAGDRFSVLVEKKFKGEKFCGYKDIKAAFFTNQGVEYKAFLHPDETGKKTYFDPKGLSLEKSFLKAPLNYSRISSLFSARRFHPVLKKYRAHPGVDYAAPKNTPIKAVADGVITSIYDHKTTGRQITIRHFGGYETSYFHMNKFAAAMAKNKRVTQGQVIGYVGKTGLATGYHLCFRMRKNGKPVNPLDQSPAPATPVKREDMPGFFRLAGQYTQKIKAHEKLASSAP